MNVLGLLENGLFALGQVLRFPVMVLLWACVAAVLMLVGGTVLEFLARRRERHAFDVETWLGRGRVLEADAARRAQLPPPLQRLLTEIEQSRAADRLRAGGLEHLVLASEERVRRSLAAARLLVKVGPSLGLLGTLIPMGTALASLSTGDLNAMAGQMVVAFTTTIIGLACGTTAFVVLSVRQSWVTEAVREQRFLAERVAIELAES